MYKKPQSQVEVLMTESIILAGSNTGIASGGSSSENPGAIYDGN